MLNGEIRFFMMPPSRENKFDNYFSHYALTLFKWYVEGKLNIFGDLKRVKKRMSPHISRWLSQIGDLTKQRGRRQRQSKKAKGLVSKTTTLHVLHAFLYISLPSLHDYNSFFWSRERQRNKFYHLCLNSGAATFLQLQLKFPSFE